MANNINSELKARSGVIGASNRKLDFKRMEPEVAAIVSKLVEDTAGASRDQHGRKQARPPSDSLVDTISSKTTNEINESNSMQELLPDIELARQILVSSILSPNDLYKVDLRYTHSDTTLDSTIVQAMLSEIESYFEKTYKIKKILSPALSDMLFNTGSYPLLVLPENAIDRAINAQDRVSVESIRGEFNDKMEPVSLGIIGDPSKKKEGSASLESLFNERPSEKKFYKTADTGIELTDNPAVLKMPMLADRLRDDRIRDAYSIRTGLESRSNKNTRNKGARIKGEFANPGDLEKTVYQRRRYSYVPILPIDDNPEDEDYGHPLVMKLPSECVIPVHVPSNPSDHLGYFILLDSMGNPLSKALESDYYSQLQQNVKNNQDLGNRLLDRSMQGMQGRDSRATPQEIEEMVTAYTDLVERELMQSLSNGIYGDNVEISRPQEVYRIMMARAYANMQTRMLYVPSSLMTYMAFDYNSFGVGRSLLEKSKLLGSIRSVLMFANTMAAVRNSVGRERLNITLDPQDPEPNRTVEFLVHEYTRTSKAGFPLGESNPNNIVDFLQKAGISLQVSGNPLYPETSMEVEDNSKDQRGVDTELEDNLRRRHIMSWGLSPETVDMSTEVDFATSVVNSNLLLSKRVMLYQEIFVEFLAQFIRTYSLHSGKLMKKLTKVIEDNRSKLSGNEKKMTDEQIIRKFMVSFEVALPSPDNSSLDNQLQAYELYERALDMAIEAYFSTEFLTMNNMDELMDSAEETRYALKAYFLRQWLRNNNMLPELNVLSNFDEEDEDRFNLFETHKEHITGIQEALSGYMEEMKKQKVKREEAEKALEEKLERERIEKEQQRELERKKWEEKLARQEAIRNGEKPADAEAGDVDLPETDADEETSGDETEETGDELTEDDTADDLDETDTDELSEEEPLEDETPDEDEDLLDEEEPDEVPGFFDLDKDEETQ